MLAINDGRIFYLGNPHFEAELSAFRYRVRDRVLALVRVDGIDILESIVPVKSDVVEFPAFCPVLLWAKEMGADEDTISKLKKLIVEKIKSSDIQDWNYDKPPDELMGLNRFYKAASKGGPFTLDILVSRKHCDLSIYSGDSSFDCDIGAFFFRWFEVNNAYLPISAESSSKIGALYRLRTKDSIKGVFEPFARWLDKRIHYHIRFFESLKKHQNDQGYLTDSGYQELAIRYWTTVLVEDKTQQEYDFYYWFYDCELADWPPIRNPKGANTSGLIAWMTKDLAEIRNARLTLPRGLDFLPSLPFILGLDRFVEAADKDVSFVAPAKVAFCSQRPVIVRGDSDDPLTICFWGVDESSLNAIVGLAGIYPALDKLARLEIKHVGELAAARVWCEALAQYWRK